MSGRGRKWASELASRWILWMSLKKKRRKWKRKRKRRERQIHRGSVEVSRLLLYFPAAILYCSRTATIIGLS